MTPVNATKKKRDFDPKRFLTTIGGGRKIASVPKKQTIYAHLRFLARRLTKPQVWKNLWVERAPEPIHLNLLSLFVMAFGSFRLKEKFDLIIRRPHAYGLLRAADYAAEHGIKAISAIEFGVANGAGLLNICHIAERATKASGVEFKIIGFDSGCGMPQPRDYRDHPEMYRAGDFPMADPAKLLARLPANATILFGEIRETLKKTDFLACPVGFISIDVDYYWSTLDALALLSKAPENYLPMVWMYFDDVSDESHNPSCGELAAIQCFNQHSPTRQVHQVNFLRQRRLFQRASWIGQMYLAHIFDHPYRKDQLAAKGSAQLDNDYL